jgi:hypothetical protein
MPETMVEPMNAGAAPSMTASTALSMAVSATPTSAATPANGAPSVRIFAKPGMEQAVKAHAAAAVAAGAPTAGFIVPTTLQGSTTHFKVYYKTGFANGPAIANGVLASCEGEYNTLVSLFGGLTPPTLPMNIIIEPGIGGAFHFGCNGVDLYCDGDTAASPNIDHTRMLVVAEEVEVFEAASGKGWNCGASPGEGLSRVLATLLYPAQLNGFVSAPSWLNAPGRPDFVTVSDPTDTNYVSIGCSTLFLNYLRYQLDFTWQEIIAAGGATLETTYKNLTGASGGITPFKNLLQQFFPAGTPVNLTTDNPFPLQVPLKLPLCGVQFTTTLPPHATQLWFTFNWPVLWNVAWNVVPTNVGTQAQVQSSVAIQKSTGGNLTYWITITNETGSPVDCEARYTVLCN